MYVYVQHPSNQLYVCMQVSFTVNVSAYICLQTSHKESVHVYTRKCFQGQMDEWLDYLHIFMQHISCSCVFKFRWIYTMILRSTLVIIIAVLYRQWNFTASSYNISHESIFLWVISLSPWVIALCDSIVWMIACVLFIHNNIQSDCNGIFFWKCNIFKWVRDITNSNTAFENNQEPQTVNFQEGGAITSNMFFDGMYSLGHNHAQKWWSSTLMICPPISINFVTW